MNNKYSLIAFLVVSPLINACSSNAHLEEELEFDFPICGVSELDEGKTTKICATRDLTAKKPDKDWMPDIFRLMAGAGHTGNSSESMGGILGFENQELNMQGHVWDFSRQNSSNLVLKGYNSTIQNGVILNVYLSLGSNEYLPPNFSDEKRLNSEPDSYAKITSSNNNVENFRINNLKVKGSGVTLSSWGGSIDGSTFILENNMNIGGSKTDVKNNSFISEAKLEKNKLLFPLEKINKSTLINTSKQIFPDRSYDKTAISSVLYIKFSPDTIIDGNTFTLTHKKDSAYAIVLDHSPRVRITNNTFNGFKVPILMDQWSSIIDDKGNILNQNQFAGDVNMNRKGEIIRKKKWFDRY